MPHKDRVDGMVRATKPLSYGGTLIEDFTLRFVGRARRRGERRARASRAAAAGRDRRRRRPARRGGAGAAQLARSRSPACSSTTRCSTRTPRATSRSGRRTSSRCTAARRWNDEAFERAGGNRSAIHVDFMIGSAELDVDGVLPTGRVEPLMRQGEWVSVL